MTIHNDPTDFLVDTHTVPVSVDLTDGLTVDQARRRQVEREARHLIKSLVRDARRDGGLSQVAAAQAWGAEQPQVSRLERDPGNAHVATLLSYLNALGAQIEIRIRTGDERSTLIIHDDDVELTSA